MEKMITCRDKDGNEIEVPSEQLIFRPSVYGILIQDGQILLSPQWDGYDFPGGGIDKGERIADALVREVKEETGLSVQPGAHVHTQEDFFRGTSGKCFHSILMWYTCSNPTGTISTDGFDEYEKGYAKAAQWVPLADIEKLKFYNPADSVALIKKAAQM